MTKPLKRRIDAIAKAVPSSLVDQLETRADRLGAAHRIGAWAAEPSDFETHFAPILSDARQELIAAAVKHRTHEWTFGPPPVEEWRIQRLAAAAVDLAPGSPRQLEAVETLRRYAEAPAEEHREGLDPWDSSWLKANRQLVTLGADQGAALHLEATPAMEAARIEWTGRRESLGEEIRNGTARRVVFLVWVQPDLEERRRRLLAQALDRRTRRASGEVLEIHEVLDAAVETVSYLPDETVPEDGPWILRAARDQHPSPGTPGHEEWVESNELYWVVGSDGGTAMRERLEATVASGPGKEVPSGQG
jgi:hypothetical protein